MEEIDANEVPSLSLTGERTLPGVEEENYWFTRHVVTYDFARSLVEGKDVLDIGCGEGYGPDILASAARSVTGVDIAQEAVEHARARYETENVDFLVADVNSLPFPQGSFDACISLQVIEHLERIEGFFEEMLRVLAPQGIAVISTPNRLTISPGSETPINPFHLREYTPGELAGVLDSYFPDLELLGIFHARKLLVNQHLRLVDFIKYYEMGRWNPRRWLHGLLTPRIDNRDFAIRSTGLERCLDIIAVCHKSADQ